MRRLNQVVLLGLAAFAGCGGGSAGGGAIDSPPSGTPPSIEVGAPSGGTDAFVQVTLTPADPEGDPVSILTEFSTDGVTWFPATAGPGSDPMNGIAPGTPVTFVWNSFADGAGAAGPAQARLRLTPSDGAPGTPVVTSPVAVDNSALASGGELWSQTSNPTSYGDRASRVASDGKALYVFGQTNEQWVDGSVSNDLRLEKRDLRTGALADAIVWNPSPVGGHDRPAAILAAGTSVYLLLAVDTTPAVMDEKDKISQHRIEKRSAQTLELDPGFGTGGGSDAFTALGDPPSTMVADADSLYLVAPESVGTDFRIRIEKRSLADGSLVAGFGTDGVVTDNPGAAIDGMVAAAVDGSSLYLAGVQDGFSQDADPLVRIEKRSAVTGALDPTFGTGGVVLRNLVAEPGVGPKTPEWAASVVRLGSFLYAGIFVGTAPDTGQYDKTCVVRVEKLNASDGSFVAGRDSAALAADSESSMTIVTDGASLFVPMTVTEGTEHRWRIEKLDADLQLVASFGTGGVIEYDLGYGWDTLGALAYEGGILYAVGKAYVPGDSSWVMKALYR